ncbi:MAG: DUF4870 domain-containing protein [Patescibacteria group bacterium]
MDEQNNQPVAPVSTPVPPMTPQQPTPTPVAPQPTSPAPANGEPNTGMAIVAYILFFIPLLTDAKKDPFVRFHVKQGFLIFAVSAILWIIRAMIPWYYILTWSWLFSLLGLATLVFAIIGIINAANGKKEKLPFIGDFADKFKFLD